MRVYKIVALASVAAAQKNTPALGTGSTLPARPPRATSLHLRWELGLNAGVTSWLTPDVAPLVGGFAELGSREHAWTLRLSGFDVRQTKRVTNGEEAHFATDWLRLEFCPIAPSLGRHLAVSPCGAFDAGVLRASAAGSAVVPRSSVAPFWAAGAVLVRLTWEIENRVILGVDGELGVPFVHREFVFDNPDGSQQWSFRVPTLGFAAKAGVGVRFP